MEQKELWQGAGYWLDFENKNIKADDFDIVEKRLNEISARDEQIKHLLTLRQYFEYEVGYWVDLVFQFVKAQNPPSPVLEEVAQARMFRGLLNRKIEHLRNLQAIEEQQSSEASQASRAQEIEDEPEPGKWTNQQAAVALYAILRAAGMPPEISDRAAGKFAGLLCGRSPNTMRNAHHNAAHGSFTDDDAGIVADALTNLGLEKVAADVRKKFQAG